MRVSDISEIARVRGEHLDRQSQRIGARGKGGRRIGYLCTLVIALESRRYPSRGLWFPSYELAGQPLRAKSVATTVSQAMGRAGIPERLTRCGIGSARNYAAVVWISNGQELMRHANMATTALTPKLMTAKLDALTHLPLVA